MRLRIHGRQFHISKNCGQRGTEVMADPSGKGSQPLVADGCGSQGFSQVGVQGCHPVGGEEAGMQEKGIQGLGDVIIGSSLHAGEDILPGTVGGHEHQVRISVLFGGADGAAQAQSVHAWHLQVRHNHVWTARLVQVPSAIAITGGEAFMPGLFHGGLGDQQGPRIIIDDEHPQEGPRSAWGSAQVHAPTSEAAGPSPQLGPCGSRILKTAVIPAPGLVDDGGRTAPTRPSLVARSLELAYLTAITADSYLLEDSVRKRIDEGLSVTAETSRSEGACT